MAPWPPPTSPSTGWTTRPPSPSHRWGLSGSNPAVSLGSVKEAGPRPQKPRRVTPTTLAVHAHLYQPPRENPWTEEVQREPSAAPFHDWNARIAAECYRPNAFARIVDAEGRMLALVNNYEHLSFN